MKQSTVIFGTLLFAFVIYITLRGQLPDYLKLFSRKSSGSPSTPTKTSGDNPTDLMGMANKAVGSGTKFAGSMSKVIGFLQG